MSQTCLLTRQLLADIRQTSGAILQRSLLRYLILRFLFDFTFIVDLLYLYNMENKVFEAFTAIVTS